MKIIPPDSKLFQIISCKKTKTRDNGTFKNPQDVDNMSTKVTYLKIQN